MVSSADVSTRADASHLKASLWDETAPPRVTAAALQGEVVADVAVIGGGLTGLSTAYHLAQAGKSVIVLEAREIGWGASGRNNGQVIPMLGAAEPDILEARFKDAGTRFTGLIAGSASYLFDLVRAENIRCDGEQTGWFQPAHSPGRVALCAYRVEAWAKRGAPVRLLDRRETSDLLGSDFWYGGLLNPTGGHVNPLALARGLAGSAEKHGVKIYERSPVSAIGRFKGNWCLTTPQGIVTAAAVVLASNAYTGIEERRLQPRLARSVVPVLSWQMASEPVREELRSDILPGRQAVSDTRGDLRFFHYDRDGRMITGGALAFAHNGSERLKALIGTRLAEAFPKLGRVKFTHVWNGFIGMTADKTPHFHKLDENLWGWTGCNGRGVALSVSVGRELSAAVCGADEQDLRLPLTRLRPIPMHSFAPLAVPAFMALYRWRDQREPG